MWYVFDLAAVVVFRATEMCKLTHDNKTAKNAISHTRQSGKNQSWSVRKESFLMAHQNIKYHKNMTERSLRCEW